MTSASFDALNPITLVGTGLMGIPMARRLLAAGFEVRAWNRTIAKAECLADEGASVIASLEEAVEGASVVLSMLENGPITDQVLFQSGLARSLPDGTIVLDMASIPPSMARDHARSLRGHRVHHVDAPVSGGVVGAEAGTLAVMAGGDIDVVARLAPIFEALGRFTHVGGHGAGQLVKLANQAIVGVTIGTVAEALMLISAGGADVRAGRDAIRGGFAESRILEVHGQRMLDRDYRAQGRASVQLKDLNTVVAEADALGLKLPIVELVRDLYQGLCDRGLDHVDHAGLALEIEAINEGKKIIEGEDRLG